MAKKEVIKVLALDHITIEPRLQMRAAVDAEHIGQLADVLTDKKEKKEELVFHGDLPVVFNDGRTNWLADGFQRHAAYRQAGEKKMKCMIVSGSFRDAQKFALSANGKHGLKRSNADKRRSVECAFADEEWAKLSDRQIAELCGVNRDLVGDVRRSLSESDSQTTQRVGADGREINVANIGKKPAKEPEKLASDEKIEEVRRYLETHPDIDDNAAAKACQTTGRVVETVRSDLMREAEEHKHDDWQQAAAQLPPDTPDEPDAEDLEIDAGPMPMPAVIPAEHVIKRYGKLTPEQLLAELQSAARGTTGMWDEKKKPIPDHLVEAFTFRVRLAGIIRELGALRGELHTAKFGETDKSAPANSGACWLDVLTIDNKLRDALDSLKMGQPFIVCPDCNGHREVISGEDKGKPCPTCKGQAFLPKHAWNRLDDSQKRAAEEFLEEPQLAAA